MQTSSHTHTHNFMGAEGVRWNSQRQTVEMKCLHFGSGCKASLNFIAMFCRGRMGEGAEDEQPYFSLFIASQLDRDLQNRLKGSR